MTGIDRRFKPFERFCMAVIYFLHITMLLGGAAWLGVEVWQAGGVPAEMPFGAVVALAGLGLAASLAFYIMARKVVWRIKGVPRY